MTTVLKVDPSRISFDGTHLNVADKHTIECLDIASATLKGNDVVAFPTETVYGLGANCLSTEAVSKIYEAKNRPSDNPLIIHVSSRQQINDVLHTSIPDIYQPLIDKFWPGPLTILLPLDGNSPISPLCTKGQSTFGCRMPAHPVARAIIEQSGLPLAAPSANASTRPSCTEARHVLEDMDGRIKLIVDGGSADVGVESTVVDGLVSPPRVLRPGGISVEDIKKYGGNSWKDTISEVTTKIPEGTTVKAPGMKYKHYSPRAHVVLISSDVNIPQLANKYGESSKIAVLTSLKMNFEDFRQNWPNKTTELIHLPLGKTKREISHNLFSKFREADLSGVNSIFVEAVDTADEGLAIMNRLNKAAEEYIS